MQLRGSKPSNARRDRRQTQQRLWKIYGYRLQPNIQAIILASDRNLPQLDVLTDKIHEIIVDSTQIYSVAKSEAIAAIVEFFYTCKTNLEVDLETNLDKFRNKFTICMSRNFPKKLISFKGSKLPSLSPI